MASYNLGEGVKIKGLDGSDTAKTIADGVNSMKEVGSKAVKKLTRGSQQKQQGAKDDNALTHDVSAAQGGTTDANCRTPEQVMEELKALHQQKMQAAIAKVKGVFTSFTTGVTGKVKSLSDTLAEKPEDTIATIGDSKPVDFGLVTSDEQVRDTKPEETATVHESEKENDKDADEKSSFMSSELRDNLLKTLIPEGSELEGFVNLATGNGRALPKIDYGSDSDGLGK